MKSKHSRRFTKAIAAVLLTFTMLLTACSDSTSSPTSSSAEKIVLQVPDAEIWGEESAALQVMYDLYTKDHPNVKLEQVNLEGEATSAALIAGKAPDIMVMDPTDAKDRYKANYIDPLDAYYTKYGW